MKFFFGSNAACAILALALITVFLFREGLPFFPQNLENVRAYRRAGLEFVDILRQPVDAHIALGNRLQTLRLHQLQALQKQGMSLEEANAALGQFDVWAGAFDGTIDEVNNMVSELGDAATARKEAAETGAAEGAAVPAAAAAAAEGTPAQPAADEDVFRQAIPGWQQARAALAAGIEELLGTMPAPVPATARLEKEKAEFQNVARQYLAALPEVEQQLQAWDPEAPVRWHRALTSFLFGRQWITNSFWQEWFGVLPLFVGSLLVSLVALAVAVPFGVCSAIYVSEVASVREQRIIKPFIEFIAAIPSVVLGFFGIVVFGETVRWLTQLPVLQAIPFFPISERLNVFTAGCLLALMAIPTIFSLAEDALTNVPRSFKEASFALGATRLQTLARVLVPASLSGIISAVLLGFGRVIGETMVVLLCAGNRIAIPDFTQGLGAFFQPVHTMTGIIAQEMGEVAPGSIHYRALFLVGVFLFAISLGVNWAAQAVVRRYRISIG